MWESFFSFITEHGKTAYDIKMILNRLEKEKLDFKKCRGIGLTMQLVWLEFMVGFNVFYKT